MKRPNKNDYLTTNQFEYNDRLNEYYDALEKYIDWLEGFDRDRYNEIGKKPICDCTQEQLFYCQKWHKLDR